MHDEFRMTVCQPQLSRPGDPYHARRDDGRAAPTAHRQANDDSRGHDRTGRTPNRPGAPAERGQRPTETTRMRSAPRLLPYLPHDAATQTPRRALLGRGDGQDVYDAAECIDLVAADRALLQMRTERLELLALQCTQDIRRGVTAAIVRSGHLVSLRHGRQPSAPRAIRSLLKPSLIRPFTVPGGSDSISAISRWVKPPK